MGHTAHASTNPPESSPITHTSTDTSQGRDAGSGLTDGLESGVAHQSDSPPSGQVHTTHCQLLQLRTTTLVLRRFNGPRVLTHLYVITWYEASSAPFDGATHARTPATSSQISATAMPSAMQNARAVYLGGAAAQCEECRLGWKKTTRQVPTRVRRSECHTAARDATAHTVTASSPRQHSSTDPRASRRR